MGVSDQRRTRPGFLEARPNSSLVAPSRPQRKPFATGHPFLLTRLLVPVDFSPAAKNALGYAGALARRFGASLTLMHVIKPICEIDFGYGSVVRHCQSQAVMNQAKARLNALGRRWAGSRGKPRALVLTGTAESEIVSAARQLDADLIVMGTGNAWPGKPLSRVAEQVLRCAPCPVLMVGNQAPAWVRRRKSRPQCLQKAT